MPNKNVYIPTRDMELLEEATKLSGEGLSVTIRLALRLYVRQQRRIQRR
jgi:hypothetical protein